MHGGDRNAWSWGRFGVGWVTLQGRCLRLARGNVPVPPNPLHWSASQERCLRLARGNLPVPPNPLHWSASRTDASRRTKKNSPSRFRFRPPLPLTFRFRLATAPYCLRTRFRPTCDPFSAQSGSYGMQGGRSRGRKRSWPQFAVFSVFNISTAFLAAVDSPVERAVRHAYGGVNVRRFRKSRGGAELV